MGIRIPGTNTMRFPDKLIEETRTLMEVKNVRSLSYTQQLRDYNLWCRAQANPYSFELYVRPSTVENMSLPLKQAIESGQINLWFIPGAK